MISTADIAKMSRREKLQALEAIWADLSRNAEEVESPAWHEEALQSTEARVKAGQEQVLDWEEAKRQLRNRSG